jgi:hypothetical protein
MKLSLPPILMIVLVQLGAVKIYATAVEALRKKERQDETQFTTNIDDSTCTVRSSENIFNSSGGAQEKGKTG